jgi:acyl dehydratase
MTRTIDGLDELKALAGQHLGVSAWREITQEQVQRFADATGDHQWIHTDVEKAKTGPFGGPIAHGYLTLAMAPALLFEVVAVGGFSFAVNYGLNKLRFPAPVPVGARIRLSLDLAAVEDVPGGVQTAFAMTFEVEGQDKPACVAEVLYRWLL